MVHAIKDVLPRTIRVRLIIPSPPKKTPFGNYIRPIEKFTIDGWSSSRSNIGLTLVSQTMDEKKQRISLDDTIYLSSKLKLNIKTKKAKNQQGCLKYKYKYETEFS